MLFESLAMLQENEVRLREILFVLGKYGLADWLGTTHLGWLRKRLVTPRGQRLDQFGRNERIRLALLELGTTFVKLGQMLSTRPDLIGRELADELSELQSKTPVDPIEVVRHTIEAELGLPPEESFEEFRADAVASASIAQVHWARLRDGRAVAVKIQHDGIEPTIHRDLVLMHGLAEVAEKHVGALRSYRPVNTVREFRRTLLRELDLRAERRNLEEFARNFAGDAGVHVPSVYPELSGRRVLTMEFLDGISGTEVRTVLGGSDLTQFVRRAATMYLDMIFRDGFYHADPHPGNYVIMDGGVVGVIDCGMVGRLDESLRSEIEAALIAIVERDVEELVEFVIRLGSPPPDLDREGLRADLAEFVADYGSRPIKELELGAAIGEVVDIIARFRIVLPPTVSLLLRTLMVLEGTAKQLDPEFSLMDLIADYHARTGQRRVLPSRWLHGARRAAREYDRLIRMFPEDAADILHRFRTGKLELKQEHPNLQASIHRLAVALIAASLLLSAALLIERSQHGLPSVLKPALAFVFLVLAAYIGYRLLRSINAANSGRSE